MVELVTALVVKDGAGTVVSRGEMKYDESGYSPTDYVRGNPTTAKVWDNTKGSWNNPSAYLSIKARFDTYGNKYESIDALNNVTQTLFDPTFHAFPIKVTTPIPDPSGQTGSASSFVIETTYDTTTGLPLTTKSINGLVTQIEYDWNALRIKGSKYFYENNEVGSRSEITYHEEPNNYWIKNRVKIDQDKWAETITYLDGLGREFKTETPDSTGSIFVEREFNENGKVKRITNPFRIGETKQWTTNIYDENGAVKGIIAPDGSTTDSSYAIAYTGNQIGIAVTVIDAAGKKRRSIKNALNQLIRVDEPSQSGELGPIDNPNQATYYTYNLLDNLTSVSQGIQTRSFTWDSLSRLRQSVNPESGTVNYNYDDNGNMVSRTDARNITLTCTYDKLNRILSRSFTGEINYQTPSTYFFYDNAPNAKGKLIKTISGNLSNPVSVTEYSEFDVLGRITKSKQITDGIEFPEMNYTYNLIGFLTEQRYPSGREVKTKLDQYGKISAVQSKKNQNSGFWNYAHHFSYTASGSIASVQLGNGKWESSIYNSRFQPTQIALGTTQNTTDLLKINYEYGTWENGALNQQKNNGNLARETITVPAIGSSQSFTAVQTYDYDSLNRLKSAVETIGGNQTWKQTFNFDIYGNKTFDENNTTTLLKNCLNGGISVVCDADRKHLNPSIASANNRLIQDQDGDQQNEYQYDASGNLIKDSSGRNFSYNADNKQIKVTDSQNQVIGQYFFDGNGQRVKKISLSETVIFVYNANGQLVAEYSNQVSQMPKTHYITRDKLGSPRIVTDQNGQVISRRDFYPFGEEISRQNYGSDDLRRKFTTYERDAETGLDYAQARVYYSNLGRFTSPDNVLNSADRASPQSWNLYTYTLNNPLTYIDPSGERIWIVYYEQDGVDDKGRPKFVLRVVEVVFKDGELTVDNPEALKNPTVQKTLQHLIRIRSLNTRAFDELLDASTDHVVGAGRGNRGHTRWYETDEGINTVSWYDPDAHGGVAILAVQLLGAAHYLLKNGDYLWETNSAGRKQPRWRYFELESGNGTVALTGIQESMWRVEIEARKYFGLPLDESFSGDAIPNFDREVDLDGQERCVFCVPDAPPPRTLPPPPPLKVKNATERTREENIRQLFHHLRKFGF